MTISTTVLAITGAFGGEAKGRGEGGTGDFPPKDLEERLLKHCVPPWKVLLVPF